MPNEENSNYANNAFELLINENIKDDDSVISSLASPDPSSKDTVQSNVDTEKQESVTIEQEDFQTNVKNRLDNVEDDSNASFREDDVLNTNIDTSINNVENGSTCSWQNKPQNEDQSIANKSNGTTIQLSLPDSIDDSFCLHKINDKSIRKHLNCAGSRGDFLRFNNETRKVRSAPCNFNQNGSKTTCIHRESISKMVQDLYNVKQPVNEETYQKLKSIPLKERSLKEEIILLINHHNISSKSNNTCSDNEDGQKYVLIENLKKELSTSENRQKEAELKLHQLQNDSLSWKDKSRRFDQMSDRADHAEKEVAQLKSLINNQTNQLNKLHEEDINSKNKCKELERKITLMDMEHSLTEKENRLLLERIENTEEDKCKINFALQEARQKIDDISEELRHIHERNAKISEEKLLKERSRIREECMKELSIVSKNNCHVWERESKLLRESKIEALNELESVKNVLSNLQANYEKILFQNSKLTAERDGVIESLQ